MNEWIAEELKGSLFPDRRLGRRLQKVVGQLSGGLGQSIPMACQDWASTKAAYRFFASKRVNEARILAGHFQATLARYAATEGPILVLHDTTEFSYQREDPSAIGFVGKTPTAPEGRSRMHTICGILMHSSLVVTPGGLPLGLAAAKFWTRKKFKGSNRLKRKINPTRVPIERKESVRWIRNLEESSRLLGTPARLVHIGDRESDIYELFCAAKETGSHFLVRTCVDRPPGTERSRCPARCGMSRSKDSTEYRSWIGRASHRRPCSNSATGESASCPRSGNRVATPISF